VFNTSVVSFELTCFTLPMEGLCPPINFLESLRPWRVLAAIQWVTSASKPRSDARDCRIHEKIGDEASGETATRHLRPSARSSRIIIVYCCLLVFIVVYCLLLCFIGDVSFLFFQGGIPRWRESKESSAMNVIPVPVFSLHQVGKGLKEAEPGEGSYPHQVTQQGTVSPFPPHTCSEPSAHSYCCYYCLPVVSQHIAPC